MRCRGLIALLIWGQSVAAADLGTWGDLWPVKEPDMLTVIMQRLTALGVQGITVYTQPCHRRSYISLCLSAQPLKTDCSLPWTQSCLPPTFHFHQR